MTKLTLNKFEEYEIWKMNVPEIPPRSIFYNLAPMHIGTADVESLSGYISRLAQEHFISTFVLLKNSIPTEDGRRNKNDKSELPKTLLQSSISAAFAKSLNGYNKNADSVVGVLEKATNRNDLYLTTLLGVKGIISNHKLLKKSKAWCPLCYEDSKNQGEIVYDKLIWTIENVKFCGIHKTPLYIKCPHCMKKQKLLSAKSIPGFCSNCICWLGSGPKIEKTRIHFECKLNKASELWKVKNIRKILEIERKRTFVKKGSFFHFKGDLDKFVNSLNIIIENIADGNINDFAHKTGVWHLAIRRILNKEVLPSMNMILDICQPIDISPADLFTGNVDMESNTETLLLLREKIKTRINSKKDVEKFITEFLSEFPPPSANATSRRTGWTTTRLERNFPEIYRQIVENYKDYVENKLPQISDEEVERILTQALNETPTPSVQQLFRRMGCRNTGYRYYHRFPDLCVKISKRFKKENNKKFNLKKSRKVMELALKENPAPSFSEIARRIQCSRDTLDRKFPNLSDKLHKRYKKYLKKCRREVRAELGKEIKKIVKLLEKEQISISENAVLKRLKNKRNSQTFKSVYKKVVAKR